MVFENVDTNVPKKQGNVGVARAVYEYTRLGYTVLAPLSDSDKYDLVIDDGQSLKRVQVKTSRNCVGGGGYEVYLATSGGNMKEHKRTGREVGDYDVLFVLTETGECWNVPADALGNAKNSIVVGRTKYNEYKI
jgi:hypothetical protein